MYRVKNVVYQFFRPGVSKDTNLDKRRKTVKKCNKYFDYIENDLKIVKFNKY